MKKSMVIVLSIFTFACEGETRVSSTNEVQNPKPEEGAVDDIDGRVERPQAEEEVCRFINPGSTPLRRLTASEYNLTIRHLFPDMNFDRFRFSGEGNIGNFEANVVTGVSFITAEEYEIAADQISREVAADPMTLHGCSDDACVQDWLLSFTERAYRRPLTVDEQSKVVNLFDTSLDEFGAEDATTLTIQAILQSPSFLYRIEIGSDPDAEVSRLSGYEVASRLSYFLWGSMPDETLFEAAASGLLDTDDGVKNQAARMLEDPKARTRINTVFETWLRLDELDEVETDELTPEVKQALIAETEMMIDETLWEGSGDVMELLSATHSYVNADTAHFYGVDPPEGDQFERIELPEERAGILTHPSLLAANGHGEPIVYRGKFLRETFFCLGLGAPPNELVPLPTESGESSRSKAEKRIAAVDEGCAGCHVGIDPLGLILDPFDRSGIVREEDEYGNPLRFSGGIRATLETDQPISGARALAKAMVESNEVRECITKQWFSYSFARHSNSADACSMHQIEDAVAVSGNNIQVLLKAIVTSDAFLYRRGIVE